MTHIHEVARRSHHGAHPTAGASIITSQEITVEGFLNEFVRHDKQMADRPFCWILGSGASIQSGIPIGGALVMQWLRELHEMENFDRSPIETWANAGNLGMPGFEYARAANFYPWVYQHRYRDYKEQGYAFWKTRWITASRALAMTGCRNQ